MFLLPLVVGILLAAIFMTGAYFIRKRGVTKNTIFVYSFCQLCLGSFIVAYGYKLIRGFEGFAYVLMGTPIILFSIALMIINLKKTNKERIE